MIATRQASWTELNQRYLSAALAGLRGRLTGEPAVDPTVESLSALAAEMLAPPAIETLQQTFGLSDFERDLLLLCAGVELDAEFCASLAELGGGKVGQPPTFSMAMALLAEPHWSALSPAGPLRRWRLIEMLDAPSLTSSPLRIDERTLHFMAGLQYLDDQLAGFVEFVVPTGDLAPSHLRIAEKIVHAWAVDGDAASPPVVQLVGPQLMGATSIAALAATQLGMQLATMPAREIPGAAREREDLVRLWERESALGSLVLLVDCLNLDGAPGEERAAVSFLSRVASPVMALTRQRLDIPGRQAIQLPVAAPDRFERLAIWESALGERREDFNGQLGGIAEQFTLDTSVIHSVTTDLTFNMNGSSPEQAAALLWDLCRERTRPRFEGLAQRIDPAAEWDDLILPASQKQVLGDIARHVRQRWRVYDDWDFAGKGRRGLGISALFSGPSGTGKTMAAEVLAGALNLDLYHIDLSRVVSKYIGETEKNLGKLFDAADGGGVILLFDEADALFGKRSEVRDSHDRYANIEVSYLLQRMEAFDGLAILTTNQKSALDTAFMRRIRFAIQFPFPDAAARAAIWRGIFPSAVPLDSLEADKLARLNVAGGNIRNIALNAAFLAADEGGSVSMHHLLQAARSEAAKLERPLSDAETRGWV